MQRIVGLLALVTGVVVAAIHVLAIFAWTPLELPTLILIAMPVILVSALTYIFSTHKYKNSLQRPPAWVFAIWTATFGYAAVNFAVSAIATEGGHVETREGHSRLVVHDRVVRELDAAGIRAIEVWDYRAISGHLLPFLVLPGLALVFVIPAGDRGRADAQAS